jgi:hypothetical protein
MVGLKAHQKVAAMAHQKALQMEVQWDSLLVVLMAERRAALTVVYLEDSMGQMWAVTTVHRMAAMWAPH